MAIASWSLAAAGLCAGRACKGLLSLALMPKLSLQPCTFALWLSCSDVGSITASMVALSLRPSSRRWCSGSPAAIYLGEGAGKCCSRQRFAAVLTPGEVPCPLPSLAPARRALAPPQHGAWFAPPPTGATRSSCTSCPGAIAPTGLQPGMGGCG